MNVSTMKCTCPAKTHAIDVRCPICGKPPGRWCAKQFPYTHDERVYEACRETFRKNKTFCRTNVVGSDR